MKTLSIDIETYSDQPLNKTGVYRYVESPVFEILLFSYSVDGAPVQIVDLACGEKIPAEILSALTDDSVTKWAFNASFERICLSRYLGYPTGDYLEPDSWRCSMVWAATMGLPLSLEGVGAVLGLEKQKLTEGKELIKYFCQPCAPTKTNGQRTRNLPAHAPDKWLAFKKYNVRDVEVEMSIQTRLAKFPVSDSVWDEYHLDQEINDRGVALDMELVKQAIKMDGRSRSELTQAMKELTELENPNSVQQMKGWLSDNGMETDTLGKKAVAEMLKTAPPGLQTVLTLRQQLAKSKNITATLRESRPMLEITPQDLDANPFLLCTPDATYDLRLGLAGAREHSPEDFITKTTTVSPSARGKQIWLDCLDTIFCGDRELIDYVQMICGLAAVGKVAVEALIIAYGCGRNGKSTFWNSISRVLGLYSGNISADTLTFGCRRNVKPEMAEVKGKRLLIAAEMQEGARLNDSTVKQLCSVDDIFAEKKYKDPFSFSPSHSLVLYTNHLPRVSASDDGTWRRLIVIPFNAKIEGKSDIKNYGDYLYQNAGESILAWIIEGAKKVIDLEYKFAVPAIVQKAIDDYRNQNDWFGNFLAEKCDVGDGLKESSSALYQAYRNYCLDCNEYVRNTADFYLALENAGFERLVVSRKRYFKGLCLKAEDEDFLN